LEKSEGKRSLVRPGHSWNNDNKLELKETIWEDVDWFRLAYGTGKWSVVLNMVMNLHVP
jgi:hypothetical protein